MSHRYSTAFSHILLAGTGIYCLAMYGHGGGEFKFPCGTYMIIISNSILGAIYWGSEDYGYKLQQPYHFTSFLQSVCAFPFVVTQALLNNSYQPEIAYIPAIASAFPLVMEIFDKSSGDLNDLLIGINAVTLGVVSFLHENYWGLACAITFAFDHFCVREGTVDFENLPVLDLYNYSLMFFCFFTLRTVQVQVQ